jgi:putative transposase
MRYIELNPVRAGMVSHSSEYRWSSYHCNAMGRVDDLVIQHIEYRRLDMSAETRQAAHRVLFRHHIGESSMAEIRDATNKAWVLGSDRFKQRVQRQLKRRVAPSARGGDRKSEKFMVKRG